MGCPGGTYSVFTRAFRAKRELNCLFLGERRSLLHPNTAQRSFFLGKLKEKLARKARVNTERVCLIVFLPPVHPIILLKSNKFNMAAVSVKRPFVRPQQNTSY